MYADRDTRPARFNPAGLTAAIAINAGVIGALLFAAPSFVRTLPPGAIRTIDVFTPEPPPPEPAPPPPTDALPNHPIERVDAPVPPITLPATSDFGVPTLPPLPPAGPVPGIDAGPLVAADPAPPPPLPTLVEPAFDTRYAADVQPIYPAAERRAGREGRVTVRVLVGIDGRVKRIERVAATSDAFWTATQDRALSKWRFRPGTRGGVPVEAWRTLSLRFVLEE